jgi:hypothetical protein
MTITAQLNDFLNTHFSHIRIPNTRFSDKSQHMLQTIIKHIFNAETQYKSASINQSPIVVNGIGSQFPQGAAFDYCPDIIKKEIENIDKVSTTVSFVLKGHNVSIAFVFPKHKSNTFIKAAIHRIYLWLYVAFQYSSPRCSQHMNIYLYFTDLKKGLPNNGEHIKEIHANTAFTTSCQQTTQMHLFREEEWFKVFIHESFHNLGLDFSEFDHSHTNKRILSIFPVKSDVRLFETYCEMWAEIINIVFIAFFSTNKNNSVENLSINKIIQKTAKMLDKERMFSLFQCAKILDFYGLSYNELYEKTDKAHIARLRKYKEETHILAYYILKSIFMFFADDFITWCAVHNANSINFNKTKEELQTHLNSYCDFIGEHYNDENFKNILHQFDMWFDKKHSKMLHKSFELNTLRMTMYG